MNNQILLYNLEAEEVVLGALLMDPNAISHISLFLQPDDFYKEKHRVLYEAMLSLHERGVAIDMLTVLDQLYIKQQLDKDDTMMLSKLSQNVGMFRNVIHYARMIEKYGGFRRLLHASERIGQLVFQHVDKALDEVVGLAEQELSTVSRNRTTSAMQPLENILGAFYKHIEELFLDKKPAGLPTGFVDLDRFLGGFQRGNLILLAARPSMGKSALAFSIMRSVALKYDAHIAFFSLEMSVEQVAQRFVSIQSGINVQRLQIGPIYEDDLNKVGFAVDQLTQAKIWVDETPAISVREMRSKINYLVNRYELDLIVVDYLQLMSVGHKVENRVQEVSYISRNLKEMAREFGLPLLALSQLSRGVESRQDKRPMMSDLRASGGLEQDGDVIMFIYRDEVYDKETQYPNMAEIIIAKQRNGPTGTATMRFIKDNAEFTDLEGIDYGDDDNLFVNDESDDMVF